MNNQPESPAGETSLTVTPETDAAILTWVENGDEYTEFEYVKPDFARTLERQRDEAKTVATILGAEVLKLRSALALADASALRVALERQHQWHLSQTDRTPVYFGDTIGQINAQEYADSELFEMTHNALASPHPGDRLRDAVEPSLGTLPRAQGAPSGSNDVPRVTQP